MTPKEKAEELFNKYCYAIRYNEKDSEYWTNIIYAKNCALIAVDEIINCDNYFNTLADAKEFINYWYEVQQEIEKL